MKEREIEAIRNILTLRYDPNESSPIPHKKWTDYSPTQSDPDGKQTELYLSLAIRRKLQDFDKIAISLSSGVDSSLLLAIIRKEFPEKKILAFHYTGVNNDELEDTKKLAERFHCDFHAINPSPVFGSITTMIKMMDSPKWDLYDYVIPHISTLKDYDILVTGDGSDELYAGYTFRYEKYLTLLAERSNLSLNDKIGYYLKCHERDFVEDQTDLFGFDFRFYRDIFPYFKDYFDNPLNSLQQCMLADFNGKLCHNFLIKKQRFSEEFKIDIFSPFMDENIVNYATHLPTKQLYKDGVGKIPLRRICQRYGLNPPLAKLGFTHDIKSEWMEKHSSYLAEIGEHESLIYQTELINRDWFMKNWNKTDERIINKLVSLYTLEKYLQWKNHTKLEPLT